MSYGKGQTNILKNTPYAADIYSELFSERTTPPPTIGFLVQDDGFFILQNDGNKIEITGEE